MVVLEELIEVFLQLLGSHLLFLDLDLLLGRLVGDLVVVGKHGHLLHLGHDSHLVHSELVHAELGHLGHLGHRPRHSHHGLHVGHLLRHVHHVHVVPLEVVPGSSLHHHVHIHHHHRLHGIEEQMGLGTHLLDHLHDVLGTHVISVALLSVDKFLALVETHRRHSI